MPGGCHQGNSHSSHGMRVYGPYSMRGVGKIRLPLGRPLLFPGTAGPLMWEEMKGFFWAHTVFGTAAPFMEAAAFHIRPSVEKVQSRPLATSLRAVASSLRS